ncbi:hypothetical protein [Candidatus Entotheonella palauensis]|uniref:Uncharacterized protein n=1 Tax=Candidatus Entotheonella gemina TaxID=1429439 RepID=W4M627_9BACT|nr:hypothetical protein [Candidatus Entotheonella palauensis]ETX05774.1 MAG: hypothetical protein ETSY2_20990 [Candidatus Entotheonella gemina]
MSEAIDATAQEVIRGALRAWGILDISAFLKAGDRAGSVDIHDGCGQVVASIRRDISPIGQVWHVGLVNRRERVFPSVVTALRYLRGHLCPEREAGRVLFGQGESR